MKEKIEMPENRLSQIHLREAVVAALEANDFDTIMTFSYRTRRVLSALIRVAYDKETLVGRRAIHAIGMVASIFMGNNYNFLRETVRKLFWSLSDESGGIGWSAPEILGEIVSADPDKMADIVPLIVEIYSVEEDVFRPGILYALMRVAEKRPELVQPFQDIVFRGLCEQDPLARVYALELVNLLKDCLSPENRERIKIRLSELLSDKSEAWIYRNDGFIGVEIREIARNISW